MIPALLLVAMAADFPQATISNGAVTAKLMLPGGSYQGTRFDWSGIVASLTWNGHEYFGQWYAKHDPKIHDAITGPVEEFLTPPGYAEAAPGGVFVRIGVGALRKPDEKAFRRFDTYEIVDPGKRTMRRGNDWIEFRHQLSAAGYSYDYRKTIRLEKSGFTIEHVLKNTGGKSIDTMVYNHNFFVIDHEAVGPDMAIRFAWTPQPTPPLRNGNEISGQDIRYSRELRAGESDESDLNGFGAYDFKIENLKALAGVHVTSNQSLAKVHFWAIQTVACPEPFLHLEVAPKRTIQWQIRYALYTFSRT
jgi:hypothetical protein